METEEAEPREGLAGILDRRPALPDPGSHGRGIVICAGGARMFTNAWVLVWQLRRTLRSTLPIEVWHLGPEEMSSGMHAMLEDLGASVVDAHAVLRRFPARISDGWQLKAYALVMSGFREVLLLDADNVPVRDPAFLLDHPEYLRTGALFWPDAIDIAATNPIWDEAGLPAGQRTSFESGQVLIDKARHPAALHALLCLNEEADRYYRLIYGDKDTFLIAWLVTGSPYCLAPHRPFVDRHVLYQRDFDGDVVFQHRTNGKWNYAGAQSPSASFQHGEACEEALRELRRIWNGRIFEPPPSSAAAHEVQRSMERRLFVLSRPGRDDRELELLPGCQIGLGRDFDCETWHVTETDAGHFTLHISDRHKVLHILERREGDRWIEAGQRENSMILSPSVAGRAARHDPRPSPEMLSDPVLYVRP